MMWLVGDPGDPLNRSWPGTDEERDRLRVTFDGAADLYHRARPDYPPELFDDVIAVAGLRPGDHILEVGTATGKATLPLARHGFRITGLEPGPNLAAAARRNVRGLPVEIIESRFEEWESSERFDLVFAATAWHWIDPETRFPKAWRLLRPRGHLALWSATHVFPAGGDTLFREIQSVYDEIGEGLAPDTPWPQPGQLLDDRAEIEATGLFEAVRVRQFDWELTYDADAYIELLSTFSNHIAMQDWQRERLFGEIRRRLAQRDDRLLRRHWGAVLHVARRLEPPG